MKELCITCQMSMKEENITLTWEMKWWCSPQLMEHWSWDYTFIERCTIPFLLPIPHPIFSLGNHSFLRNASPHADLVAVDIHPVTLNSLPDTELGVSEGRGEWWQVSRLLAMSMSQPFVQPIWVLLISWLSNLWANKYIRFIVKSYLSWVFCYWQLIPS